MNSILIKFEVKTFSGSLDMDILIFGHFQPFEHFLIIFYKKKPVTSKVQKV